MTKKLSHQNTPAAVQPCFALLSCSSPAGLCFWNGSITNDSMVLVGFLFSLPLEHWSNTTENWETVLLWFQKFMMMMCDAYPMIPTFNAKKTWHIFYNQKGNLGSVQLLIAFSISCQENPVFASLKVVNICKYFIIHRPKLLFFFFFLREKSVNESVNELIMERNIKKRHNIHKAFL